MYHLRPTRRVPAAAALAALGLLATVSTGRAAGPELTATGATIPTGSDLLETAIVVEKLLPPARPGQGGGRFVPATRLEVGDEVHYTLRVRNPGKEPVSGVQVTKRMPEGLHYIEGSAVGPGADVEFSVDGGDTFEAKPDAAPVHARALDPASAGPGGRQGAAAGPGPSCSCEI